MQEASRRRTSDTTIKLKEEELQEKCGFERRRIASNIIETSDENAARLASNRLGIAQRRQTHIAEQNKHFNTI